MTPKRFIIVDDDECNNMLCKFMLRKMTDGEVLDFTNPEEAIAYISADQSTTKENTILLLDINMPEMTGWQFLDWFDKAPARIKNDITIFMVSSSIDQRDKERADANPYITHFFTKPLQKAVIEQGIRELAG